MKARLKFEYKPVAELVGYKNNARTHSAEQVQQISNSIKRFGFITPVVLHKDNQIMAGHGRIEAAKLLKLKEVPTVNAEHLTDAEKRAFIIADNRLAELAGWDMPLLKDELIQLNDDGIDINDTGFSLDDIDIDIDEGDDTQDDEVPDVPTKPKTKLGDLIELGKHRLLCGDCTDKANVDKLMKGVKADLMLTDPPYSSGGFQEAGKASGSIGTQQRLRIANDNLSTRGYKRLIGDMLKLSIVETILMFGDWRMWIENYDLCENNGFRVRNMLVWNKNWGGMGRPFKSQHELIVFGSRENVKYEIQSVSNVLSFDRCENELHATQKPVQLLTEILRNFEKKISAIVYDPFLGSGTTLIACEKTGRKCYGTELDPAYCDVIVKRWCEFTGNDSVKVNGKKVKYE